MATVIERWAGALETVNDIISRADSFFDLAQRRRVGVVKDYRDRIAIGYQKGLDARDVKLTLDAVYAMEALASASKSMFLDANGDVKSTGYDDAVDIATRMGADAKNFAEQFTAGFSTLAVVIGIGIAAAIVIVALRWVKK
jgi:hypothetical protein